MTHAIVLIQADRSAIKTLGGALADVEGVAEAYSVTGEWDFVAMLRVRDPAEVAAVVTQRFAALEGIKNTQTLVAFEVFSQHDLEALFSDLALPKRRGHLDVALVPIGGHYTMDRFDAVTAVEFIDPAQVIPCHYDTFPPIETDAQAFKEDVQNAGFSQVYVLEPGQSHTVK